MGKAQTEIMGFAIIAIILIAGILFAAKLVQTKEEISYKKEFISSYLSYNMAGVFLRTASRDCGSLSMSELLLNCADNSADFRITCGTLDSCAYVEQEAKEIFGKTMDEWNAGYEFTASSSNNNILSFGECGNNKKSKQTYVAAEKEVLTVSMDIC